uniref:Uncharacterized protein n=1 Tax=Hucho hucho TaxID=62062 RepID=A0A4W5JR38_9TELE
MQSLFLYRDTFISKLSLSLSFFPFLSDNRDDQFPRVCVVAFLSRLQPSNQLHERLMEELVLRLLKKDEAISKSKQRYYSNSLQHRIKNRVWQTLLILLPKLRGVRDTHTHTHTHTQTIHTHT